MRLRDKTIAITGAGRGIGFASAALFAREGARVVILEIDEESGRRAEQAIREKGGNAEWIGVDVSDFQSVQSAFKKIEERYGQLHCLYNNASVYWRGKDGPVSQVSVDNWHQIIGVNLHSLFYCCRCAVPLILKSGGGSIIHTSSSAGVIGIPNCDAYTAAKGATVSLTRSMAVEFGPKNIRVNCIAPAAVYTEMLQESSLNRPDFDEEAFFKTAPLGRYGTPEEIANIALFLASDESSYLNGAIIVADGGITVK